AVPWYQRPTERPESLEAAVGHPGQQIETGNHFRLLSRVRVPVSEASATARGGLVFLLEALLTGVGPPSRVACLPARGRFSSRSRTRPAPCRRGSAALPAPRR